jgi:hypothetical protein
VHNEELMTRINNFRTIVQKQNQKNFKYIYIEVWGTTSLEGSTFSINGNVFFTSKTIYFTRDCNTTQTS